MKKITKNQFRVIRILLVAMISYTIFSYILIPLKLQTDNMEPTYTKGSVHLIYGLRYIYSPPKTGDVVAIKMAGKSIIMLARVVATPNQSISISNGKLKINNLASNYILNSNITLSEQTISDKTYFVSGDNILLNKNSDFHGNILGLVDQNRIIGKVVL